jgi:tRNA(Ile2) C34 agmatinyltransferase TiaS
MTPHCPMCDEPMKEHGRVFLCEPCRQIIIFLVVSETSPYVVSLGAAVASNEKPRHEA